MSIIVEDGTGRPDSESYIAQAYADTYHLARNNAAWAALDVATKEAALRNATDYMVQVYRSRWKGRRVLKTQALDWPRVGVVLDDYGSSQGRYGWGSYGLFQVDYTVVPPEVQDATAILALQSLSGPLMPALDPLVKAESVGGVSVTYQPGAKRTPTYPAVDQRLNPLFLVDNQSITLSRC